MKESYLKAYDCVSYEVAQKVRALGFPQNSHIERYASENIWTNSCNPYIVYSVGSKVRLPGLCSDPESTSLQARTIAAPSIHDVFRWLDVAQNVYINIVKSTKFNNKYTYYYEGCDDDTEWFNTYQAALEAGVNSAVDFIFSNPEANKSDEMPDKFTAIDEIESIKNKSNTSRVFDTKE